MKIVMYIAVLLLTGFLFFTAGYCIAPTQDVDKLTLAVHCDTLVGHGEIAVLLGKKIYKTPLKCGVEGKSI